MFVCFLDISFNLLKFWILGLIVIILLVLFKVWVMYNVGDLCKLLIFGLKVKFMYVIWGFLLFFFLNLSMVFLIFLMIYLDL